MAIDPDKSSEERGPTGKERMRRRAPKERSGMRTGAGMMSVKGGFSDVQLKEIGAIILEWNELEEWSGMLLSAALDLDSSVATQVSKSINGLEARFSIVRSSFKALKAPRDVETLVLCAMAELSEYKKIRDLLGHCRMWNEEMGIAHSQDAKTHTWEVLVTTEALEAFYNRVCALKWELISIGGIFSSLSDRARWVALADSFLKSEEERHAREAQRRRQSIQEHVSQLKAHQKKRQQLPQLPLFPDARAIQQARARKQRSHPKSTEKPEPERGC